MRWQQGAGLLLAAGVVGLLSYGCTVRVDNALPTLESGGGGTAPIHTGAGPTGGTGGEGNSGAIGGSGGEGAEGGAPPAGCLNCHNNTQDNLDGVPANGRRAIGGEFPGGADAHGHFSGSSATAADCQRCHAMGEHKSGIVRLVDPDQASLIYEFVTTDDLTTDPDLSDFCAHCHDVDGGLRFDDPRDPFETGDKPAAVAEKFQGTLQWLEWYGSVYFPAGEGTWRPVNSHHDISDADQAFSGAKLECLSCHSAHGSARTQPLANPDAPTEAWAGTTNAFCVRCHGGGNGPDEPGLPAGVTGPTVSVDADGNPCVAGDPGCDRVVSALRGVESCAYNESPWYVTHRWSQNTHGPASKRGWSSYSGAPGADLDCVACHDAHGSYSEANPAGNPYLIRDTIEGASSVDDGTWEGGPQWNGPPWTTFGQSREVIVPVVPHGPTPPPAGTDYSVVGWGGPNGLCTACHAQGMDYFHFHGDTSCQSCHGHNGGADSYDWATRTSCGKCHSATDDMATVYHGNPWTDGQDVSCNDE